MGKVDPTLLKISGIPLLIAGVLCVTALVLLNVYGVYPQELTILYFQMALGAAGVICILIAMEALMCMSRLRRGIRNALIFDILISIIFTLVLFTTGMAFRNVYLGGTTIMGSEVDLWDEYQVKIFKLSFMFGIIASIILFLSLFYFAFLLYKNLKRNTIPAV